MAVINGTNGDDSLDGTSSNDTIYGKGGSDSIEGLGGNDSLDAGGGDDLVFGGPGDDKIYGKGGLDSLDGGDGNDSLYGDDGSDFVHGGAGNDILKGGLGGAFLFGEDGNDQLYYNPLKGKISDINDDVEGSYLGGGDGYDTLNVFNETTYTNAAGETQNSWITIDMAPSDSGDMYFEGNPDETDEGAAYVGFLSGIEEIKAEGKGGLLFSGSENDDIKVTGTNQGDEFYSWEAHDTFLGGGDNDYFSFGSGDKIESWTADEDVFNFVGGFDGDAATIEGFNKAFGDDGGDTLWFNDPLSNPATQISESGGKTTFTLDNGDQLIVDTVGLKQNVDYFFV